MKKISVFKILILVLVFAMCMSMLVACTTNNTPQNGTINNLVSIPEFSLTFVDYNEDIVITDETVSGLSLCDFSRTSHDVTTYYKGLKISDLLPEITSLQNQTAIESLIFVATDGYGAGDAMPASNFENSYIALLESETLNGTYAAINEDDGPLRVVDLSETGIKSVKNLEKVYVNRALDFELNIVDGSTNLNFTEQDVEDLDLVNYTYTKIKDDITYTTYYKGYSLSSVLEKKGIDISQELSIHLKASDETEETIAFENIGNAVLAVYTYITITSNDQDVDILTVIDSDDGPIRTFSDADSVKLKQTISITINHIA